MSQNQEGRENINLPQVIISFAFYLLLTPGLLFLCAGTLSWPTAWLLVALGWAAVIISRVIAVKVHPDMLKERARFTQAEDTKSWDKKLGPLVALWLPALTMIVSGFDHRFAWTPAIPPALQYLAVLAILVGYGIATWAFAVNRYFSAVARIQADRGQTTVTCGPYRWVRHPGYAGGMLNLLAQPLMLDAAWALIPAILAIAVLVLRTHLEDRMLLKELPGYQEYAAKTRFRLIPGVW